jgi:hypothetical protein
MDVLELANERNAETGLQMSLGWTGPHFMATIVSGNEEAGYEKVDLCHRHRCPDAVRDSGAGFIAVGTVCSDGAKATRDHVPGAEPVCTADAAGAVRPRHYDPVLAPRHRRPRSGVGQHQ